MLCPEAAEGCLTREAPFKGLSTTLAPAHLAGGQRSLLRLFWDTDWGSPCHCCTGRCPGSWASTQGYKVWLECVPPRLGWLPKSLRRSGSCPRPAVCQVTRCSTSGLLSSAVRLFC